MWTVSGSAFWNAATDNAANKTMADFMTTPKSR
jgi:hypothetical protein